MPSDKKKISQAVAIKAVAVAAAAPTQVRTTQCVYMETVKILCECMRCRKKGTENRFYQ